MNLDRLLSDARDIVDAVLCAREDLERRAEFIAVAKDRAEAVLARIAKDQGEG